jgi:hypothetical protein
MADHIARVDRLEHFLDFFRTERRGVLPSLRENFGVLTSPGGGDGQNALLGQAGKHHPDRGHVLLDRRS